MVFARCRSPVFAQRPEDWIREVLCDPDSWKFGLSETRRHSLHSLSSSDVNMIVGRLIEVLNRDPEYWLFSTVTMLIEEGLGKKAAAAIPALNQYLRHPQESYRHPARNALRAVGA
jgi:hypothetical protein